MAACGNAQNKPMVLMQNVKIQMHSNIYKVVANIMIEKTRKTHYSNIVIRDYPAHKNYYYGGITHEEDHCTSAGSGHGYVPGCLRR
jgi:hypothetical protein